MECIYYVHARPVVTVFIVSSFIDWSLENLLRCGIPTGCRCHVIDTKKPCNMMLSSRTVGSLPSEAASSFLFTFRRLYLRISSSGRTLSLLLFVLSMLSAWQVTYGQVSTEEPREQVYSVNGLFEELYDREGNVYALSELEIPKSSGPLRSGTTCTCGYFQLYFEDGSGMEIDGDATHLERRAVACQVMQDLSDFIVPQDPSNLVRILVRDIGNMTSQSLCLGRGQFLLPSASSSHFR